MRYQLVLQWPASSSGDFDAIVELEDHLIDVLSDVADVDGHDFGSGTTNIFILTNEPQAVFERARSTLEAHERWSTLRAAYRDITGETWTILWPRNLAEFDIM